MFRACILAVLQVPVTAASTLDLITVAHQLIQNVELLRVTLTLTINFESCYAMVE